MEFSLSKKCINRLIALAVSIILIPTLLAVNSYAELGDIGEPASSYNGGSACMLEGRNVIVSFYVDTPESSWKTSEIDATVQDMKIACNYIENEASKYGVETSFEYDWSLGGLNRRLYHRAKINFITELTDESDDKMRENILKWVSYLPSYEAIADEYDADNVFMIVFLSQKGRSFSLVYDSAGEDSIYESLILYKGDNPSVMAHEILHLFGAHDYYSDAEYTEDVVSYIKKKYPNEIMLKNLYSNGKITSTVSRVTAYHLGWLDSADEVEQFPQLTR